MDVLDYGVPTFVLLAIAGAIASIYTGLKLKLNAVHVINCLVVVASLAAGGFAIGEMGCHAKPADGAYQGELINPTLHFSYSMSILLVSLGGIIMMIIWAVNEADAVMKETGRHKKEFSGTLMDRAENDDA